MSPQRIVARHLRQKTASESTLERELASLLNRFSAENGSNTPDFLLAEYLLGCLELFNQTTQSRAKWYGEDSHIIVAQYLRQQKTPSESAQELFDSLLNKFSTADGNIPDWLVSWLRAWSIPTSATDL